VERLLVTGVDTLLGSNLALALSGRCEVFGLYDRVVVQAEGVETAQWRPGESVSLAKYFDTWQPQWILHCGPLAGSSWEATPEAGETQREVAVVGQLGELAHRWGSSLVVLSSDAVFSGPRMFHDERWPASSTTARAVQSLAMEKVAATFDALVVRTHAYGWNVSGGRASFAERALRDLNLGCLPTPDGRRYATPILATDLADLLWRAYETRLRGLYHLAGAERVSTHRFLMELAASLGVQVSFSAWNESIEATCHEETSLSSKRARRMLAASTPMLREGLDRFVAQSVSGWRDAWHCLGPVETRPEAAAA
jgi:dTDP-4-dehydrorhamnose reductase